MSKSLWPHGLQHTRLPCPSLSPVVFSDLGPLSLWCHPTISFSVAPFSSCPQSFSALGPFPLSQLLTSDGQRMGAIASASASVLPVNIQGWFSFRTDWLDLLQSRRLSRVFSNTTLQKHQFFGPQPLCGSPLTSVHDYWKNP